jgi:Uma2 family endonuclease
LTADKYREPDVVFVRPVRIQTLSGHPVGADLTMEVVSEGLENHHRDYVEKRREYAAAGIAEYWIVDPQEELITVLKLDGNEYREHGVYAVGARANSVLLPGFEVSVQSVFAQGEQAGG